MVHFFFVLLCYRVVVLLFYRVIVFYLFYNNHNNAVKRDYSIFVSRRERGVRRGLIINIL